MKPDHDAHLLELSGRRGDWIRGWLRAAEEHQRALSGPHDHATASLVGRTIGLLFFEDSTRTRLSFAAAAQRLGATTLDLVAGSSSVNKGESLLDTAATVRAMGVDALVVRHRCAGAPHLVAAHSDIPVVNAGDGRHEHPTQGLLDALTLCRALGTDDFDLTGRRVLIVGDGVHSRVARSSSVALSALGARVSLVGPPGLMPTALSQWGSGIEVERELDPLLPVADAVMMLRVQFERSASIASSRSYRSGFALTTERAEAMPPHAWVMHPGPANIGLEIDVAVAQGPRSLIREQVRTGVAVRMAALQRLVHA